MKWAHIDEIEPTERLLYWVMMFVLIPYFDDPIDHWLKKIFNRTEGFGGDPGWEIEPGVDEEGNRYYSIWADPEISGIEPSQATYSVRSVQRAVRESLLALIQVYPERSEEINNVINRYKLR